MEYGLIGEKLGHSYSVSVHKLFGDYRYELKEIGRGELDAFMRAKEFCGVNVTIPYKRDVIPYLDEISPQARSVGAVNTIVNDGGRLLGYNTDYYGFEALADGAGIALGGRNVLILGSGGTYRTVKAVCDARGARSVRAVSRRGELNYDNVYSVRDAEVIVNASPCGMYPRCGDRPLDLEKFPALKGVIDAIYNPLKTRLVLQAEKLGVKAAGGLAMLVAQGAKASELFTGRPAADVGGAICAMKRAFTDIVLVGMPGCGKSTVGRALAAFLGREFADTDEEAEKRAGKSIPEIFAENGESAFREIESEAIDALARGGRVLATGGGALLRAGNAERLKQNGRIYYLRRPLAELTRADRPLSQRGSLEEMFAARRALYEAAADAVVDNHGSPEAVAEKIAEDFLK